MQQQIVCPVCGSANPPGQKFCLSCGSPLNAVCPNCGASINPGDKFCGNCGAQLPVAAAQSNWAPPQQPAQQQYVPPQQQEQKQYAPPQQPPPQYTGGQDYGQTNYAGAQQQRYAPQQPYQQAPAAQGAGWAAPQQRQSSMPLIILLVVLIIALGGFAWWAFMGNPPWSGSGGGLQVTNGPFIQALSDNTTTTRDVTITLETSVPSIGKVDYGIDENYGSTTAWETTYTKTHSIAIPGLTPDTRYHYRVTVKDKSNNEVETVDTTFKTPQ